MRTLSTQIKENEHEEQRENCFHKSCQIKTKTCNLIIDVQIFLVPCLWRGFYHHWGTMLNPIDCNSLTIVERLKQQSICRWPLRLRRTKMKYFLMWFLCKWAIFYLGDFGIMIGRLLLMRWQIDMPFSFTTRRLFCFNLHQSKFIKIMSICNTNLT